MAVLLVNDQPIASGSTLTIYKYEPFSYVFTTSSPEGGLSALVSKSTLLNSLVFPADGYSAAATPEVYFQSPGYDPSASPENLGGYNGATSTAEQLVIGWGLVDPVTQAVVVQQSFTINVIIAPGRFIVPLLTSPSYTMYKNEAISFTFGEDIRFQAPGNFVITAPFTVPALPPGISFVPITGPPEAPPSLGTSPSRYWDLTGTPLVESPATSYIVYGRSAATPSFVISKTITIGVAAERIVPFVTPSSNISLTTGSPISTTTLTAAYPSKFPGNLRYDWSFLPDGLQFRDNTSNVVMSPFFPLDSNATMILTGTPTVAAAQLFRSAGVSNVVTNVIGTRQTSPGITVAQPFSLTFTPTVLFDSVFIPTLYAGVPLDPSANVFTANTYFPFSAGMASITASSLPTGLSLLHTPGDSNAYLTGTPTVAGSGSYGIVATNSNGVTQTLNAPITVAADTVTIFGPANDVCYNFVISRPLNTPLTGYYPAGISYSASAASGANVTLSVTNLAATGITVTTSGSTLALSGIPDTITPFTTAVITATAPFTGATATRNLKFEVLTDDITLTNPTSQMTFFQNQEITPVQFAATTLSERPIVSWSSPNLPAGLSLSSTGRLTGAPAVDVSQSATFNVVASTGYVSESIPVTYKAVPDDVLIFPLLDPTPFGSQPFSNVEITALSYSGKPAALSVGTIIPTQNPQITLNMTGDFLSGNLSTGDGILTRYRFNIDASVGALTASQSFFLDVDNASIPRRLIMDLSLDPAGVPASSFPGGRFVLYQNENKAVTTAGVGDSNVLTNWTVNFSNTTRDYGHFGDFARSGNTIVVVSGNTMYRSSNDGTSWQTISSGNILSIGGIVGGYIAGGPPTTTPGPILVSIANDGTSNWLALGVGYDSNVGGAARTIIRRSTNNGVTWFDTSLTSPIAALKQHSRLFYNRGRYFLAQEDATYPALRADVSDLSVWTGSGGGMPYTDLSGIATTFSFNNDTVICGGPGNPAAPSYTLVSQDNGTTWGRVGAPNPNANPGPTTASMQAAGICYVASGEDGQLSQLSRSLDGGVTFDPVFAANPIAGPDVFDFDGTAFVYVGAQAGALGGNQAVAYVLPGLIWPSPLVLIQSSTNIQPSFMKRMLTTFLDGGPTGGRISLVTGNTAPFILPTSNTFSLLQYVPATIPIQLSPTGNFIHYYASNLPQGMRLTLDPSGISASITGTPSLFDPNLRSYRVFARDPITNTSVNTTLKFQVTIPLIVKKQGGAADYTALVRQYATVNGAQAARNSVALPVQERPLGEFMSPDAPSVITQTVDPKCFSTSNCT